MQLQIEQRIIVEHDILARHCLQKVWPQDGRRNGSVVVVLYFDEHMLQLFKDFRIGLNG
jgi:hypothetical protein